MQKIIFGACLFLSISIKPAFSEVKTAFTPSEDCEKTIVDLIDQSTKNIDIAVYAINNKQIVKALIRANKRNVELRILTDRTQASNKGSKVKKMHEEGLNIRVHTKNKLMHNKFAIFDGQSLFIGSYNWTNAASKQNSEGCTFLIKEPENIKVYQEHFEKLWHENTLPKSEKWFEKQKNGKKQ